MRTITYRHNSKLFESYPHLKSKAWDAVVKLISSNYELSKIVFKNCNRGKRIELKTTNIYEALTTFKVFFLVGYTDIITCGNRFIFSTAGYELTAFVKRKKIKTHDNSIRKVYRIDITCYDNEGNVQNSYLIKNDKEGMMRVYEGINFVDYVTEVSIKECYKYLASLKADLRKKYKINTYFWCSESVIE